MIIYAIDPGTEQSALVGYDIRAAAAGKAAVVFHSIDSNELILRRVRSLSPDHDAVLVVEQIEAMGMPVGAEVFTTVWWAGRFHQAWPGAADRVTRRAVKLHLCGSMRAKDPNIRQAILDRFGGKARAIGNKHAPGPLHGIKGHEYAALAVALTWADAHNAPQPEDSCRPQTASTV